MSMNSRQKRKTELLFEKENKPTAWPATKINSKKHIIIMIQIMISTMMMLCMLLIVRIMIIMKLNNYLNSKNCYYHCLNY